MHMLTYEANIHIMHTYLNAYGHTVGWRKQTSSLVFHEYPLELNVGRNRNVQSDNQSDFLLLEATHTHTHMYMLTLLAYLLAYTKHARDYIGLRT